MRDPYLVWAESNDFAGLAAADANSRYGVMIETLAEIESDDAGALLADDGNLCAPPAHPSKYWSALVDRKGIARLSACQTVRRVELAHALAPVEGTPSPRAVWRSDQPEASREPPDSADSSSSSDVLLAVVDDVCPFAHRMLRTNHRGSAVTKLSAWWDQNDARMQNCNGYGREISASSINTFLSGSANIKSGFDEHVCYERVGYLAALSARSHSAHSWGLVLEDTSDTSAELPRLLHVQYPNAVLEVPSNAAMCRNTLDAIRWVLSKRWKESRVVISMGYVSPLGPHDDSSIFAKALEEEVNWWTKNHSVDVKLVFAAGNDFKARQHARIPALKANAPATLKLRLSPNNKTNTFVEIWIPDSFDAKAIQVQPPTGKAICASASASKGAPFDLLDTGWHANGARLVLLRLGNTVGRHAVDYGDWLIRFLPTRDCSKPIDAYVSRGSGSLGARRHANQSRFVEPRGVATFVDPKGTLSGMACGGKVFVVGGYKGLAAKQTPSDYTASGPTRDGKKTGPEYSVKADDSSILHGVRSAGNRSGITFRMDGTSVAAPQFARLLTVKNNNMPAAGNDPRLGKQV